MTLEQTYLKAVDLKKSGKISQDIFRDLVDTEIVAVVHAHWIDTWGHSLFECSACGNEFDDRLMLLVHQNDFPNYCPNCGAKMDEVME